MECLSAAHKGGGGGDKGYASHGLCMESLLVVYVGLLEHDDDEDDG